MGTAVVPAFYRVLVLEDSPADYAMLVAELDESRSFGVQTDQATRLSVALCCLVERQYDAVFVDLGLPDSEGLETFRAVREAAGDAAVIILTGRDDEALAEHAVREGAQDYLLKGVHPPGDIARALRYAVRRQQVQLSLQRAKDAELAGKDRFLSHVSHELRSPLAVIHQFVTLLRDGIAGDLTVDQREFLSIVLRNLLQLRSMIDDLLAASHGANNGALELNLEAIDLRELLRTEASEFRPRAEAAGLSLTAFVPQYLPPVRADGNRVREVVGNLLDNAIKFTPHGGQIAVSATPQENFVGIEVRDNGVGIAPEDLPHVFEQFYQGGSTVERSRNGIGLGLYLCRELVNRHGGRISAASDLERGTRMRFTLPVYPAESDEEHGDDQAEDPRS